MKTAHQPHLTLSDQDSHKSKHNSYWNANYQMSKSTTPHPDQNQIPFCVPVSGINKSMHMHSSQCMYSSSFYHDMEIQHSMDYGY